MGKAVAVQEQVVGAVVRVSNKSLTPEIVLPSRSDINLDGLPTWLGPDGVDHVRSALLWGRVGEAQLQGFALSAVMAGSSLLALKRIAGAGRWESLYSKHIESRGLSMRTAQLHMQVAKLATRQLAAAFGVAPDGMTAKALLADPDRLTPETMTALKHALGKATTATTWRGLLSDLGGSAGKGGYRPSKALLHRFARERGLDVDDWENWPPHTKAQFREWSEAERRRMDTAENAADPDAPNKRRRIKAEKVWHPFLAQAIQGYDIHTWDALSPDDRRKMVAALQALAGLIEKTIG